jgi:hypothetical protein
MGFGLERSASLKSIEGLRSAGRFGLTFLYRSPQPVAVAAGLNDVRPVCDAIEQSLAEPSVGDHLGPLEKWQIGGQDHGRLLGSFSDDLEKEFSA